MKVRLIGFYYPKSFKVTKLIKIKRNKDNRDKT